MRAVLLILGAGVLVVAESAALGTWNVGYLSFQLGLGFVVYLSLRRPIGVGALVLSIVLVPIDSFACGPAGHYAVACALVFGCIHLLRAQVQVQTWVKIFVLGLVSGLLHGLIMMSMSTLSGSESQVAAAVGRSLLYGAVLTGFGTLFVVEMIDRLSARFDKEQNLKFAG